MKHLHYEKKESTGFLTIHRPESLNALNHDVLQELWQFITLAVPHEQLKVLVITGSGDKAFIAGADIEEMQKMTPVEMQQFSLLGQTVTQALEAAPLMTIAAIKGFALGGGLEIALACDFILVSENAKLGLPEITLGLIPGFGGTQRLLRSIGIRQAKELILTGRIIDAQEGLRLGLVNHVYPKETLLQECHNFAKSLIKNSFFALQQAKKALNKGQETSLEVGLELEKNLCALCFSTPEREQAMTNFLKKKS